jgi:hypothetical protein
MRSVIDKLKSQQGASLLIVLLFFLICAMVASSLLMAAVSNAGKTRSRQQENQRYLAVSSALQLICDDISNAVYYGQYEMQQQEKDGIVKDVYKQQEGEYTGDLKSVLVEDFDSIFALQMRDDIELLYKDVYDRHETEVKSGTLAVHKLTVTPQSGTAFDVYVKIELEFKDNFCIYVTASLEDYVMQAEMTATATVPTLNTVAIPGHGAYKSSMMTWKIGWIIKS